jgi:hypothetical protein
VDSRKGRGRVSFVVLLATIGSYSSCKSRVCSRQDITDERRGLSESFLTGFQTAVASEQESIICNQRGIFIVLTPSARLTQEEIDTIGEFLGRQNFEWKSSDGSESPRSWTKTIQSGSTSASPEEEPATEILVTINTEEGGSHVELFAGPQPCTAVDCYDE